MSRFPQRLVFFGVTCALLVAVGLLAWSLMTGSSLAQSGSMHNCPPAGMWSIAVWEGESSTEASDALATCGTGTVAAAYSLEPQTGAWSRWFAGRAEMSTLSTLDSMQGVIALGAAAAPPPGGTPTPTPTAMPAGIWTGLWDTTFGKMQLTQTDSSVTGIYEYNQGKIEGTVQGDKLVGTWSEPPSYAPPDAAGDFEFTLSSDGNSFDGRWRYDSAGDWEGEWTGTRIEGYLPPPEEVGHVSAGGNAVVTTSNDTPYTLTVEFQGPTVQTITIPRCDTCHEYSFMGPFSCPSGRPEEDATLVPGEYTVTARVDDPSIPSFVGHWTLEEDTEYFQCFFIVTTFG